MQGTFQPIDLIRHFTPNWFTVCMGTGVVALLISELPVQQNLTWFVGTVLWQLNILLFVCCAVLYTLRWLLFPHEAKQIFKHPVMSLFLGAIPMALATLINGLVKYGQPLYGDTVIDWAVWLWYIDAAFALLIAWLIPFVMYAQQKHKLENMTALWLLPIVVCEVAASSAGVILSHVEVNLNSVALLLASYVLWGISVLPAFAILAILMLRLALHQLPAKELAISSWLALGPIGTGALALLLLGNEAPRILALIDLESLGVFLHHAGILVSLILFGFALWWLDIAVLTTWHHAKQDLPFNLGWWGLTFPLGVLTLALFAFAAQLHLSFIYTLAYALTVVLLLLWSLVSVKTVYGLYQGRLIFSPCLKTYLVQQATSSK